MTGHETVIGLEVHVQLRTATKMFCRCPAVYGAPPNTSVCPVCLGLPGALPVPNRAAFRSALRVGLAVGGRIAPFTKFDRKQYFYPDLPKGYQISQFDLPFCDGGAVEIDVDGRVRSIRLERIHLEEDAGKNTHAADASRVDLNRAGTPLLEIVTKPEITGPDEAYAFLTGLRRILLYLEVSDCNMEEGSLRCDANVSVRPAGQEALGTKAEIKNLNSFKNIRAALEYEVGRQVALLEGGGRVLAETRLWDEDAAVTRSMRSKEEALDYRYFPDPDLPPLTTTPAALDALRATLPELPRARRRRYVDELGLSDYDAGVLTADHRVADYFEAAAAACPDAKAVANLVTNRVLSSLNDRKLEIDAFEIGPVALGQLVELFRTGTISSRMVGDVFAKMIETGRSAAEIVESTGGGQIGDEAVLRPIVERVVADNPNLADDVRAGNERVLGALVGRVMQATGGKADPRLTRRLLAEILS